MKYKFSAIANFDNKFLFQTINDLDDNHIASFHDFHSLLCQMAMTDEIKYTIVTISKTKVAPAMIVNYLHQDGNLEDLFFKNKIDFYNARATFYRAILALYTLVKILIRFFINSDH